MFNKLYSEFKKFIKNNFYFVLFLFISFIILNIEIPYNIETSGSLVDLNNKVNLNNQDSINGSYNLTYVSSYKARIGSYLISLFDKNMNIIKETNIIDDKTEKISGKLLLDNSLSNAYINAYKLLNRDLNISNNHILLAFIGSNAITDLKIGDKIEYVNNIKISNINDIEKIIKESNIGDKLLINEKNYAYIIDINGKKSLNLYLVNNYEFSDINSKFEKNESGSSGGLMISLIIYDKLNKIDLSKGRIIAGTGTIDSNGKIGEISGITYKILGALKSDVFFLPYENFEEADKFIKERKININLVPVKTLEDAVNYLKK